MLLKAGGPDLGNAVTSPGVKLEDEDCDAVLDELRERDVQAVELDGEVRVQADGGDRAKVPKTSSLPRLSSAGAQAGQAVPCPA